MTDIAGIGMLTTIEDGEPRLRPLDFVEIDGQLWAGAHAGLERCDGQHVEVLFFNEGYDLAEVHGILRCSHTPDDHRRLHDRAPHAAGDCVVKIIPQHAEVLRPDIKKAA
jgi:hypothetical protein